MGLFIISYRELQKIITDERRKREEKETAIEKLKNQLKEASEKLNESRNSEQNLQSQLEDVKKQLENDNAPLIVMEKLKRELLIMKEQHSYAVQQVRMNFAFYKIFSRYYCVNLIIICYY